MNRSAETLALAAAAAAGVALWLRYRRMDGSIGELELEDVEEITISARRLPLPADSKGPPQRLGPWKIPAAGEPYRAMFESAEARHGVPALLLARQAYQESRFRSDIISGHVRSSAGAVGIMQIVPKHHPEIGEHGALDPPRAIDYAAKYMRQLYDRFGGKWELALAAYNAGPGNVVKYGGIPPFRETQAYVAEISRDVGLA